MARKHTAWLKTLIETIPAATTQTFVSYVAFPAPSSGVKVVYPYWVIHPATGTRSQSAYTGPRLTAHPRFVIHSVGEDADQAAWAAEQVEGLLVVAGRGVVPTITGERAHPVQYSSPMPIQVDNDVDPAVCFHIAEVSFTSDVIV